MSALTPSFLLYDTSQLDTGSDLTAEMILYLKIFDYLYSMLFFSFFLFSHLRTSLSILKYHLRMVLKVSALGVEFSA